jgi:hypothetical protein
MHMYMHMEFINNGNPQCGSKRPPSPFSYPDATAFIIQTPHGLEHVAAEEIQRVFASQIVSIDNIPQSNGIMVVKISAPPSFALLRSISLLACADAAAIYCGVYAGLSMDQTAIDMLKTQVLDINWKELLEDVYWPLISQEQPPQLPTFRCTCSRTIQMADWGYNRLPAESTASLLLDPAVIFARCSDSATSQMVSHVSAIPVLIHPSNHPIHEVVFVASSRTRSWGGSRASIGLAGFYMPEL